MYLLIAEHAPMRFGDPYEEEVVARFTTFEAADQYLKASKLKSGPPLGSNTPFRQSSLLCGATGAYVQAEEPELVVPVDPKLGE